MKKTIFSILILLITFSSSVYALDNKTENINFNIWDSYLVTWDWDLTILRAGNFTKNFYLDWWLAPNLTIYYWYDNKYYKSLNTSILPEWKWPNTWKDWYRVLWYKSTFWIKLLSQIDNKSFNLSILSKWEFNLDIKKIDISDYELVENQIISSTGIVCDSDFKDWKDDTWNWFKYNGKWFYKSSFTHCFWKEKVESIYNFCNKKNSWISDIWNWFFSDKWVLCFWNNPVIEEEKFWKKELNFYGKASICNKNTSCYWKKIEWIIYIDKFKFIGEENGSKYVWVGDVVYEWHKLLENVSSVKFELLNDMYYKDSDNVFYNRKIIDWADSQTFKALHQSWWVDKNNLYLWPKKMDVDFDYDTITVVSGTPIDKNQAYTSKWPISHKEFIDMEWKPFEELGLSFPMKTNYLWIIYNIIWFIVVVVLVWLIIIKNKSVFVNIFYYIYSIFILYIWWTWYYNYAITDKKRLAQDSLSWIGDLFWEHVVLPTFFMNNNFAHMFYSELYLYWFSMSIYFPIILIIFSLLWVFIFIKNRDKKLNYLFLVLLLLSLIFIIHMFASFFYTSWSIWM